MVATSSASGKSLCYNISVLDTLLHETDGRAIYLFPTKALAQDQVAELMALNEAGTLGVRAFTFDGDTQTCAGTPASGLWCDGEVTTVENEDIGDGERVVALLRAAGCR